MSKNLISYESIFKNLDLDIFLKKYLLGPSLNREYKKGNEHIKNYNFKNVNNNILNNKIITNIDRGFNIEINNIKVENIEDFNIQLQNITTNGLIIKKIKLMSYQQILKFITDYLIGKFDGTQTKDFLIPYLNIIRSPTSKININIFIDNKNEIIYNLNTIFDLYINNDKEKIACKIEINYIANLTENKISLECTYVWTNQFMKRFVTEFIKKFINNNYFKLEFENNKTENAEILLEKIINILFGVLNNNNRNLFLDNILSLIDSINNKNSYQAVLNLIKEEFKPIKKNIKNAVIPIKKNIENAVHSDFLIVSYNEEAKQFNDNDCISIIDKVNSELPSFIVVCTQESRGGDVRNVFGAATHYQHILQRNLELNGYKMVTKDDASVAGVKDKNVRSRFYINTRNVAFNKENFKKKINGFSVNSNYEYNKKYSYQLTKFETATSKRSGLGSVFKKTFYKGSIMTRVDFVGFDNTYFRIIVVNSHLYYKKDGNTGLPKRKEEFMDIVQEFNLISYWEKGYNIFFCGDLNFRLDNPDILNKSFLSETIAKTYVTNNSLYKKNFYNQFKVNNELSSFLKNTYENPTIIDKIKNKNPQITNKEGITNFFKNLFESIEVFGLHLTYKYFKGKLDEDIIFFNNAVINMYEDIYEILPAKNRTCVKSIFGGRCTSTPHYRVPSSTDRILFSLAKNSHIKISPYNFNIQLFPDKSDHKMITLSFELEKKQLIEESINTTKPSSNIAQPISANYNIPVKQLNKYNALLANYNNIISHLRSVNGNREIINNLNVKRRKFKKYINELTNEKKGNILNTATLNYYKKELNPYIVKYSSITKQNNKQPTSLYNKRNSRSNSLNGGETSFFTRENSHNSYEFNANGPIANASTSRSKRYHPLSTNNN